MAMANLEEQQQEKHWKSAQSVALGLDLIAAAQSQLRLLAAVHSHPHDLYQGPSLQRAIRRYENYWLSLLSEHGPYSSTGIPLIPPLDCAWIWHCHRLNPVQYIKDCKTYYGKLLDAGNTFADTDSEAVAYTQQLWDAQFPGEKYEIDLDDLPDNEDDRSNKISYDLQAAVERQSSFFYQVSRPHMGEKSFLKAALQRYKGFLYLLKLSGLGIFLVPTYDIDLMWHSHQASPGVYREDTVKLLGRVLNHDDTDSDRTEGMKLDTGFHRTREFWQLTFGSSYERAGAMYRGEAPALFRPFSSTEAVTSSVGTSPTMIFGQGVPGVQARKTMQLFISVQKARNLHTSNNSIVAVRLLFEKKCSMLELETSWIKGAHNLEWNDFWALQCEEATGGIRLELRSQDLKCCNLITTPSLIGWVDFSWQTLLNSSTLSWDGWVPLLMKLKLEHDQKPTSLRISASITPPVAAPFLLRIERSLLSKRNKSCLSKTVYDQRNKKSFVVNVSGSQGVDSFLPLSIQIFQNGYSDATDKGVSPVGSATCLGRDDKVPTMMMWSLCDGNMQLAISSSLTEDCQPYVQVKASPGDSVRLLHGRKCQYEVAGTTQADELGFMTLVRRTPDASFGKATALFNWKSGAMEISPEESGILVLLLCTIIAMSADNTQCLTTLCKMKRALWRLKGATNFDEWGSVVLDRHSYFRAQGLHRFCPWYSMSSDLWMSTIYNLRSGSGGVWTRSFCELTSGCGTCGGGCGGCGAGGCGNSLKAIANGGGGGCGGCGAGGCMNGASRGRGGGCGACGAGGCGNNLNGASRGRGGGCGACGAGGCGNNLKNGANRGQGGGCGACGAGGCGNSLKTGANRGEGGGCGACGAGGCGNNLKSGTSRGQGGGSCGGCGAGGCGNGVYSFGGRPQGGGCGGCGAGGCGNNIKIAVTKGVQGGRCGGCGAGGCGNNRKEAPQGGGCGGCGAGGCGNSIRNGAN